MDQTWLDQSLRNQVWLNR